MRKNVFLLIVSLALTFTACNKVKVDTYEASSFVAETDIAALQDRLEIFNTPVDLNKSTQATLVKNWNLTPHLYAKTDDGLNQSEYLSASSVAEDGAGHVYVGFHDRGDLWYGEIVQVDETAGTPITGGAVHSNAVDVNDLEINGSTLYIAGESYNRGAEALKMSLTAGSGVLATPQGVGMPIWGASGNSVTLIGNKLWVSAGGSNNANMSGGLAILDLATVAPADPVFLVQQDNGKHFDADGDYGLWIQGNNASQTNLYIFQSLTTGGTAEYRDASNSLPKLPFGVTAFGKNAVDVEGTVAYVAMGAAGVFRVELAGASSGSYTRYFDAGNLGFANGVATDGYFVYVANGADGLIILSMDLLTEIGRWNESTRSGTTEFNNGSCNYVAVGGAPSDATSPRELFVAFGRGGLTKLTFTP